MATLQRRNNRWFAVLLVLMVLSGFCIIGYWQTYDTPCVYGREWSWTVFPPQFVCRTL